ncbi:PKD domain-containing protein [bacterium]|nr:PKD domain-containing protein [bacterium]
MRLGSYVNAGERIGYLGNEGASGGWAHLHFEIKDVQPSGLWGTEPSYAYLREGYVAAENPPLLALARPHQYGFAGDAITLDAGKSESFAGEIVSYDWEFTDETTANGETVTRTYDAPGFYTEVLKVTDSEGNVAYDFATVQIVAELDPQITQAVILSEAKDLARPGSRFQSLRFSAPGRDTKSRALAAEHLVYTYLHLAHAPSKNIRPGDKVRFIARVFGIGGGEESWDFDDGSPIETTRSGNWPLRDGYAQKTHVFTQPGDYLVRVERVNKRGEPCVARVWVPVRE